MNSKRRQTRLPICIYICTRRRFYIFEAKTKAAGLKKKRVLNKKRQRSQSMSIIFCVLKLKAARQRTKGQRRKKGFHINIYRWGGGGGEPTTMYMVKKGAYCRRAYQPDSKKSKKARHEKKKLEISRNFPEILGRG